ncbi:hypothetical protein C8Q70DRAFT_1054840 [Cubamyces menziesii]|nr:hypothetical protein C8Q70DRAFT_1054840 [Cubamyces menziesii]
MLTPASTNPAVRIHLPGNVFVSGCPVEGEVELNVRILQEENVQEVRIELKGVAKIAISHESKISTESIQLANSTVSLWTRGTTYPPPGEDTLRVPFHMRIPANAPPPFEYNGWAKKGSIRYTLVAVCVKPGAVQRYQRVYVPLAVAGKDTTGVAAREKLSAIAAGAQGLWRVHHAEENIRKGLWGDYATVEVDLRMPDIGTFPLYVPIPFEIDITTRSAPLPRSKADAYPRDKPVFPPVPTAYHLLEFKLRRHVHISMRNNFQGQDGTETVADFCSAPSSVEQEVPEREWVPLESIGDEKKEVGPATKGTWIQRAMFRSTFRLDCAHSFSMKTISCTYALELKVPFPGIGNDVHVRVPLTITSGIDKPTLRSQLLDGSQADEEAFDVLPAYEPGDNEEYWEVQEKVT